MPLPNPNELRQKTKAAIAAAEERHQKKLALIKIEDEQKAIEDMLRAEKIISQIPDKCAQAAENGLSYANVMSLKSYEYKIEGNNWTSIKHHQLKGAGAIVWNECQTAQLNPTLEYWHDGCGMESGFNIVVHWE